MNNKIQITVKGNDKEAILDIAFAIKKTFKGNYNLERIFIEPNNVYLLSELHSKAKRYSKRKDGITIKTKLKK